MRRRLFGIVILVAVTLCAYAQPYTENYELLTTRQGLPHNTVRALLQDSYGFLWIGTNNKVCVYDGHSIKVLDHTPNMPGPHSNTRIVPNIFEARNGDVWVGSWGNFISCYERSRNKFKVCYAAGVMNSPLTCICEDNKGVIWVGTANGGIGRVGKDSLYYMSHLVGYAQQIMAAGPDSLIIVMPDSIVGYNTTTHKSSFVAIDGWQAKDGVISCISPTKNSVFITNASSAAIVDLNGRRLIRKIPVLNKQTESQVACPDRNGGFTYTDGYTIKKYDHLGLLQDSLVVSENLSYNRNEIINCALEDNDGILWMGSNSGLIKVDRRRYRFIKYSQNSTAASISYNYVRGILADGERIWLGVRGGEVSSMRLKGNTYKTEQVYRLTHVNATKDSNYTTNTFLKLRDGRILAGGGAGVYILEKNARRFTEFMPGIIPAKYGNIWSLYEDAKGYIWIGGNLTPLLIVHPVTGACYSYTTFKVGEDVAANCVWSTYRDRSGSVWLAANDGLLQVENDTEVQALRFKRFPLTREGREHVWSILEDSQGALWVGSVGEGLFRISADRKKVDRYMSQDMPYICSIVPDTHDNIWIGTLDGLYRFDHKTQHISRFDEQDGIASTDFNFKAATITPAGNMLFGTKVGMLQFCPDSISTLNLTNAPVHITNMSVAGKDIAALPPAGTPVELAHEQNQFEVDVAVLDFSKPGNHKFRYQLQGFETVWNYTEAGHSQARYTNIPPGSYRLIAEGSADGEQWSRNRATLDIYIKPAFWQRPVFWIIVGAIVVLVAAALVYSRIRMLVARERKTREIEQQMAELELKALQAQMNPHFIFNTINAIQHFIVHKEEKVANDYLSRFARLMRMFLEASKNKYVTIEKETGMLELYLSLEKLRFGDKFNYSILHSSEDIKKLQIPAMLIQPFAENAIIHGLVHRDRDGMLTINFELEAGNGTYVLCTIEDNGIGRERSSEINAAKRAGHISRGTQLIEERIKTYNFIDEQHIEISYTDKQIPDTGTIVALRIPVNRANVYIVES